MYKAKILGLGAATAAGALALAACGSSGGGGGGGAKTSAVHFNEGLATVVNPSSHKSSGTITFEYLAAPDSTDPANTYYVANWNFIRLYTTSLMTYKSCPGNCGLTL